MADPGPASADEEDCADGPEGAAPGGDGTSGGGLAARSLSGGPRRAAPVEGSRTQPHLIEEASESRITVQRSEDRVDVQPDRGRFPYLGGFAEELQRQRAVADLGRDSGQVVAGNVAPVARP